MEDAYASLANPSLGDILLSHLLSAHSMKLERRTLCGIIESRYHRDQKAYNVELSRLKKNKLISYDKNFVKFDNRKGAEERLKGSFIQRRTTTKDKIIILFDVPEEKRIARNWVRSQLKVWDFSMMQRSVWLGTGPIPKEFTDKLKELGIRDCVKMIQVSDMKEMKTS